MFHVSESFNYLRGIRFQYRSSVDRSPGQVKDWRIDTSCFPG